MVQEITVEELQSRAGLYVFLASLYKNEMSGELIAEMERAGLFALLQEQGYAVSAAELQDEQQIEKLAIEFTRVFIGPGKHVSLYASVHHPDDQKKGRLWGETTVWVRKFIMDHGLKFEGKQYEGIPDHISCELEFMTRLLSAEIQARTSGDKEKTERLFTSQQKFFQEQLGRWVPGFCKKVQQRCNLTFYKEFSKFTEEFIALEAERLA